MTAIPIQVLLLTVLAVGGLRPAPTPLPTAISGADAAAAPLDPVAAWSLLGGLAGPTGASDWDADLDGDGSPDTVVSYRLIGGGSALVETLFAGDPHEMETIHHLDRGPDSTRLLCTHYCGAGNQPRLVATSGRLAASPEAPRSITYSFLDATNLPDRGAVHMNGVTFTFHGPDRVDATWTASRDGVTGPHATFAMSRRAPADAVANTTTEESTMSDEPTAAEPEAAAAEPLSPFAILMLEDDDAWAGLAESERAALMEKYTAYVRGLIDRGRFVWGTPLGRETVLLDGPPESTSRTMITPRKDVLTGVFVIRAKDLAEAEAIARECPALLHGERVQVRPATH